jgi:hypothetical protein
MAPAQREPRLGRVVESPRVERPQISVNTLVLNVAVGAFPGNVPVHASLRANPVSDGLVTRQAEIRRDLPVRSMATLALANPVERGVGLREGTGRRHLTGLCEGCGRR